MATETPRRIMLATDLTPAGDRAFDRAVQLAREWKSELTLCHVIESSAMKPWGMERRVRNAETELERLTRSANLGRPVPRHIVIGDAAERTLEHARQIGCDFLVTGPAHGKVPGDKLLGGTAARMVRRATQPVLAVRRRPEGPYGSVVTAVDLSVASSLVLRQARGLFPSARMTALHAFRVKPDWGGMNEDKSIDAIEEAERTRARHAAERQMSALLADAGKGAGIETAIHEGAPDAVLADLVEREWPDLVVAGAHGAGGSKEGFIGSVAELLLMTLPCDVLVVPARG